MAYLVMVLYFRNKMVLLLCGSPFPPLFWQDLFLAVIRGSESTEESKDQSV